MSDTYAGFDSTGPASSGAGARLSVYPLTDGFVELILDALAEAPRPRGLEIATDDVSTFIRGREDDLARYLYEVITRVAARGYHVGGHLMLSRGSPEEVSPAGERDGLPWAPSSAPHLPPTGYHVAAHWSLYPSVDVRTADVRNPDARTLDARTAETPVSAHPGRSAERLSVLEEAIGQARADGTLAGAGHFVIRLEGDLADVLETVVGTWIAAGRRAPHVVTHVTFTINRATAPARGGAHGPPAWT